MHKLLGVKLTEACGDTMRPTATPLWNSGQCLAARTAGVWAILLDETAVAAARAAFEATAARRRAPMPLSVPVVDTAESLATRRREREQERCKRQSD